MKSSDALKLISPRSLLDSIADDISDIIQFDFTEETILGNDLLRRYDSQNLSEEHESININLMKVTFSYM